MAALPVDEIPCVEVWDMSGLVFNSHSGMNSSSKCKWSSLYGDGLFHVDADIIGDFSIMCRFGGQHALTRDKTTLIFKYQNSTGVCSFIYLLCLVCDVSNHAAFLPPEVIELSKQNVDINPEYADSVDVSTFSVHLLFEVPSAASLIKPEFISFAHTYQLRGKEAFEAGLDEVINTSKDLSTYAVYI
jgi:hypothetical protein